MLDQMKHLDEDSDLNGTEAIPGMIYCNPKSGMELVFGYNDLIPDPRNKWYSGEYCEEKLAERTLMMMDNLDFLLRFWKRKGYYG